MFAQEIGEGGETARLAGQQRTRLLGKIELGVARLAVRREGGVERRLLAQEAGFDFAQMLVVAGGERLPALYATLVVPSALPDAGAALPCGFVAGFFFRFFSGGAAGFTRRRAALYLA